MLSVVAGTFHGYFGVIGTELPIVRADFTASMVASPTIAESF